MNIPPTLQTIGNLCAGLAAIVFLLPLQHLLWDYARRHVNNDQWVTPALFNLIPLWLLLLGALLCVTASGGFDWLRLGRLTLYAFTAGSALALAVVSFVFVALYIRPGFTPRFLYSPAIYLIPLTTGLLVVLSLNPKLASVIPIQWLRWPWTIFAALSLVGCAGFFGYRLANTGIGGLADFTHSILNARDTTPDHLAKIATLDPQQDFTDLLRYANPYQSRAVREAATIRLRSRADFIDALVSVLNSPSPENGLEFVSSTTFSYDEQKHVALPARGALERFIDDIPAPNYMSSDRRKQLLKWGRKTFPLIAEKFSGTDVDFSEIMPKLEYALRPEDTRR